ncbi:hypothetical protein [Bacillus sp. V33-4]|uniref:hypothetical protein n=1 Tax=Bacillus sp. V33-4 TaxID=2054169 RepID=UPI0015E07ABC|nr:hypothetical protein [Bacillus sp. V33-4]
MKKKSLFVFISLLMTGTLLFSCNQDEDANAGNKQAQTGEAVRIGYQKTVR